MGSLPFSDTTLGRTYDSGALEQFNSGSRLNIASGASLEFDGTALSSSVAELNTLDGVATTWPDLLPSAPAFTIGAESSNIINVAVQLNDVASAAIAASKVCYAYLSGSSAGDGLTGTAPDGGVAIGTDGTLLEALTASKSWMVWTESDGQFDIDITHAAGALTVYLCVVVGTNLYVSNAITFA